MPLFGLINGLGDALSYGLRYGIRPALSYGLSTCLSISIASLLIPLTVSTLAEHIHLNERVTWTWSSLKNSLLAPEHLTRTLLLTGSLLIFLDTIAVVNNGPSIRLSDALRNWLGIELHPNLMSELSNAIGNGLSDGLGYWLLAGVFQGIAVEQIEDQDRQKPNQGIHRSLHTSAFLGLISGGVIGAVFSLSGLFAVGFMIGFSDGLRFVLDFTLSVGVIIALMSGCFIFLLTGGVSVLRHFIIRLLLSHAHLFPWRASTFLDDATTRILLRRVGGGYSFIHRRLQDYFADAAPPS